MGYRVKLIINSGSSRAFLFSKYLFTILVVAAATEYYDDSEDYNPSTVIIVEDMAKAVVIHNMFLRFINHAVKHRSLL